MNTDETLFRAYGIAASLLRSNLRDGTIDARCETNHYSPEDTQAVKEAVEKIAGDLSALMYVHLRQMRKIGKE